MIHNIVKNHIMKSTIILASSFLFMVNFTMAQEKFTSVDQARKFLSEQCAQASQPGLTYMHSYQFETGRTGQVILTISKADAKGKSSTVVFEFFLEHLEPNKIMQLTSSKELKIHAFAKGDQRVVRSTANLKSVQTSFAPIYFDDMQKMRDAREAILYLMKESPVDKVVPKSEEDAYNWMENNIKQSYSANGKQYDLHLNVDRANNNKTTYTISEADSKGKIKLRSYEFYMQDFNLNSFRVVVLKNQLTVNMVCANNIKAVKYFENSVQKSYLNRFNLVINDAKLAMDLIGVLQYLKGGKTEAKPNTDKK